MQQTVAMTKIVQDILNVVKYHYKMNLDESTFNYSRFDNAFTIFCAAFNAEGIELGR